MKLNTVGQLLSPPLKNGDERGKHILRCAKKSFDLINEIIYKDYFINKIYNICVVLSSKKQSDSAKAEMFYLPI